MVDQVKGAPGGPGNGTSTDSIIPITDTTCTYF